jgi:hypothetical protein
VSARDVYAVPQFPPPDDYLLTTENLDQLAAVFSRQGSQATLRNLYSFPLSIVLHPDPTGMQALLQAQAAKMLGHQLTNPTNARLAISHRRT